MRAYLGARGLWEQGVLGLQASVLSKVVVRHAVAGEPLLGCFPAISSIQLPNLCYRFHCLIHAIHDKAGDTVID
jgi:hypothetical protein